MIGIRVRCRSPCTLVSSSFLVCLPYSGDGLDFSLFLWNFLVLWIFFVQRFSSYYFCGTIIFYLIGFP